MSIYLLNAILNSKRIDKAGVTSVLIYIQTEMFSIALSTISKKKNIEDLCVCVSN